MANVFDVATYILEKVKNTTTWKLQKLVYYSQAWHAVWSDEQLFPEETQAWANGPVCRALYIEHKGRFQIAAGDLEGDPSQLTDDQRDSIDRVIDAYNGYSGQQLSDLTHSEKPWRAARKGVPTGERSEKVISVGSMVEYYSSLLPDAEE